MPKQVILTAPYPTLEEVAKMSGISKRRLRELVQMANEFNASYFGRQAKTLTKKRKAKSATAKSPAGKTTAEKTTKRARKTTAKKAAKRNAA